MYFDFRRVEVGTATTINKINETEMIIMWTVKMVKMPVELVMVLVVMMMIMVILMITNGDDDDDDLKWW